MIDAILKSIYRHQKKRRWQVPIRCPFCNRYVAPSYGNKKKDYFSKYFKPDESMQLECTSLVCGRHSFSYKWLMEAIKEKEDKQAKKKTEELTLGYFLEKFWR